MQDMCMSQNAVKKDAGINNSGSEESGRRGRQAVL